MRNLPKAGGNFRRSRFSRAQRSWSIRRSISMAIQVETLWVTSVGRPLGPGDSAIVAPRNCPPHLDRQPTFCTNLAWGGSEGLGPTGNTIPLLAVFRACNLLI